jgi:hypothetical protein
MGFLLAVDPTVGGGGMTAITTAVGSVITLGTTILTAITGSDVLTLLCLGFPIGGKAVHFIKGIMY